MKDIAGSGEMPPSLCELPMVDVAPRRRRVTAETSTKRGRTKVHVSIKSGSLAQPAAASRRLVDRRAADARAIRKSNYGEVVMITKEVKKYTIDIIIIIS